MAGRKAHLGQGGVAEPAVIGCPAQGKAAVHKQAAEQENPKAERVQLGEGHVAGTDHQGDDEVSDPNRERHNHQENHGGAVHGEQLIVSVAAEELCVRLGQLDAHQQSEDSRDEEIDGRGNNIKDTDTFVIHRGQPAQETIPGDFHGAAAHRIVNLLVG